MRSVLIGAAGQFAGLEACGIDIKAGKPEVPLYKSGCCLERVPKPGFRGTPDGYNTFQRTVAPHDCPAASRPSTVAERIARPATRL